MGKNNEKKNKILKSSKNIVKTVVCAAEFASCSLNCCKRVYIIHLYIEVCTYALNINVHNKYIQNRNRLCSCTIDDFNRDNGHRCRQRRKY